jgi:hypothetical protein
MSVARFPLDGNGDGLTRGLLSMIVPVVGATVLFAAWALLSWLGTRQ